jgi:hypothetical protein
MAGGTYAPVLDFANGHQEEVEEEDNEIEEIRQQESDAQEKTGEEK